MVNYNILLWDNSQDVHVDEYLENLSILPNEEISSDREILNKNPFVKFIDMPMFMHVMINYDTMKLESRSLSVSEHGGDIMFRIKHRENRKKMYYIIPPNNHEVSRKGPTIYNPIDFRPVQSNITRSVEVSLSDRQIEEIIFENEYIDEDAYTQKDDKKDKLFYFKTVIEDSDSPYATMTKTLMETKSNLSEKAYNIFSTLCYRTRIPDEETFNRWLKRLEKIGSNTTNNDYMYILIKK